MSKWYMNVFLWWTAVRYTMIKLSHINEVDFLGVMAILLAWILTSLMVHAVNVNWKEGYE